MNKKKLWMAGLIIGFSSAISLCVPGIQAFAQVSEEAEVENYAEENHEEALGPLTPDGNMTLVDDLGPHESTGKQFITVTSKNGNFFYIIIDRDDSGENTVHFLNLVDEEDLMSLVDEDYKMTLEEEEEARKAAEAALKEAQEAAAKAEAERNKDTVTTVEKTSGSKIPAALASLAVIGAGGGYLFYQSRNKKNDQPDPDDDDYYEDDEDYYEDDGLEYIDLPDEPEEMLGN